MKNEEKLLKPIERLLARCFSREEFDKHFSEKELERLLKRSSPEIREFVAELIDVKSETQQKRHR